MATSTDAQRLIAMSLGKIAASRGQRGGINLHKNLLVASVLHKARTIFMLENYQNMMETRRLQLGSQETSVQASDKENMVTNDHEVPCLPGSADVTPQQQHQPPESSSLGKPSCMFASSCDNGDENKENSPLHQQPPVVPNEQDQSNEDVNDCSEMSLECTPCTKRRISDDLTENDSQVVPCAKKLKLDSDMESSVDSVELLPKSCEQIQGSPTSQRQIKNLVHSFNSGFTGLLNVTDNTTTSDCSQSSSHDQGYSSADEDEEDDVFVSNQSTCQKPENSLISCSTQIKEAFETLARPIIALTV